MSNRLAAVLLVLHVRICVRCSPFVADDSLADGVTPTTGPNGDINWLNCGVNSASGWNPPYVTMQDIVSTDLNAALQQSGTPFTACSPYVWAFYQYGNQFGSMCLISFFAVHLLTQVVVSPIILAVSIFVSFPVVFVCSRVFRAVFCHARIFL